jgi:hypothetical protein
MRETLDQLRDFGVSISEAAKALNVTLDDLEHWTHGDLRSEIADVIEVGLTLLLMRLRATRARYDRTLVLQ